MAKNAPAARGFLGSLILLVVALLVFFLVLAPGRQLGPRATGRSGGGPAAALSGPGQSKAAAHGVREAKAPMAPRSGKTAGAGATSDDAQPDTGDDDPDVTKAINLIDNGDISEAVALLERVLKREPQNEQALVEMAMVSLLDLKQPDAATGYLQRVMEVNPSNQVVLSELVSLYEEQGKLDEGLGFLMDLSTKTPGSPEIAYGIGQLLSLAGRDGDAVGYLEKAAQAPDNQVRAYRDLGEAYARSGEPEKAVDSYAKAITSQERELSDRQARGLPVQGIAERLAYTKMDKARVLIRLGDTEEAQQLLDEVKTVMPADASVTALQETLNRRRAG